MNSNKTKHALVENDFKKIKIKASVKVILIMRKHNFS